jgi:hypothetical protein
LNSNIIYPIIIDSTSLIANENVGGYRNILSHLETGKNNKDIVAYESNINVSLVEPILSGYLQIIINFHLKLV